MKRAYESPLVMIEQFTPNEYVAACGDNGTLYNFTCNVSGNDVYYYPVSDGSIDGVYTGTGKAERIAWPWGISGCGETHQASNTNDFYDGFIYNGGKWVQTGKHIWDGYWEYDITNVIVWRERGKNGEIVNEHLTSNLDINSWSVARS